MRSTCRASTATTDAHCLATGPLCGSRTSASGKRRQERSDIRNDHASRYELRSQLAPPKTKSCVASSETQLAWHHRAQGPVCWTCGLQSAHAARSTSNCAARITSRPSCAWPNIRATSVRPVRTSVPAMRTVCIGRADERILDQRQCVVKGRSVIAFRPTNHECLSVGRFQHS